MNHKWLLSVGPSFATKLELTLMTSNCHPLVDSPSFSLQTNISLTTVPSGLFLVTHVCQPSFRYKQFYNVQFGKGQKLFDCESSNISGEFFVSSSLLASEQTCVLGNGAR